jgi:hypothetical protein
MSAYAYRSSDVVASERIREIRAGWEEAPYRGAFERARGVAVSRVARACAGVGGSLCGLCMLGFALACLGASGVRPAESAFGYVAETALLAGGGVGLACGLLGSLVARALLSAKPGPPPATATDFSAELAKLQREEPLSEMRTVASKWELPALWAPLVAIALLVPLTLHFLVALLFFGGWSAESGFRSMWLPCSALVVGHAHLALAIASVVWARALRKRPATLSRSRVHQSWAKALGGTIVVALLPTMFLFGGGSLFVGGIVTATGLAFVPWAFLATAACLVRERAMLGTE